MTTRIEWRTKGKGDDALLVVGNFGEDSNTVLKQWDADPDRLADFLNDMDSLDDQVAELETDVDKREPHKWGDLVLARSQEGGDVLNINPELYWDGIYFWFRSRGRDPHPSTRR